MNFSDLNNPRAAAELIANFKKRYSAKVCLHPSINECSGEIISAHTLSVSSMLRPISKNGHVYALKLNMPPKDGEQPMKLALRGLRETSVFNGFCATHDKSLFAPIEDSSFICSHEQLFIFAYRAVCKEVYLKRKQAESLPTPEEIKKIHGHPEDLQYSAMALSHQAASFRGAEEIERLKSRLDKHLMNRDFNRLITTVFQFNSPPPLTASFVYAPDYDFEGNDLQDFHDFDNDLSHLMVTLFSTPHGGFLLLSYEDTANTAPRRLVETLDRQEDLSSSIAWLIACQTENFAISPEWFDSLTDKNRTSFINGFFSNAEPFHGSFNNLIKKSITVADWKHLQTFIL